jgi:DNA-binding PadR family transcriptional regulator
MLGGAYHTNSIHRALKWLEDQGFIVRHAAKTTHRFVMKVRSLTKRLGKESNRLLKERREKKKNNLRYSSNRKHNNKNRFSNSSKQQITKDDRIQNWVEKALMYLDGQGDPPQKIQRDDVRAWMTGGQNAASMFWEPIRSNLGHLLV